MKRYEKIAKALAICMPETQEESMHECVECPFYPKCPSERTISLPMSLMIEIRQYFSANNIDSPMLQ